MQDKKCRGDYEKHSCSSRVDFLSHVKLIGCLEIGTIPSRKSNRCVSARRQDRIALDLGRKFEIVYGWKVVIPFFLERIHETLSSARFARSLWHEQLVCLRRKSQCCFRLHVRRIIVVFGTVRVAAVATLIIHLHLHVLTHTLMR